MRKLGSRYEHFTVIAMVAFLYFLSGKLSLYLSVENTIVTLAIFFAEGVSLAAVLIYGIRVWVGVFLGQLLLALTSGLFLFPALGISVVNSLEVWIAYRIFSLLKFDPKLRSISDLYTLFGVILLLLQPFSAFWGNLCLILFTDNRIDEWWQNLFAWWFGNSMGQMLLTPLLLLLYRERRKIRGTTLLWVLSFFTMVYGVIFYFYPIYNYALLSSLSIPLIMLVLTYVGLIYAMFGVVLLALGALISMHFQTGIFAMGEEIDNMVNINFYIFAHLFVIYVYGILFEEKERVLRRLKSLNLDLERRVKEEVLKRQENEKMLMLRSRQAQMGEMISMIAHQWKQPLNTLALVMNNLYMKYQLKKIDDAFVEQFREEAQRQINHMSTTISDFRNFFKPQSKVGDFDPCEILEKAVMMIEPLYRKEGITIKLERCTQEFRVTGYANELIQVLINLMHNAKDVILERIQTCDPAIPREIVLNVAREENEVCICVQDHAGGVDSAIIESIFDPYFSTKTEKNGTGLGLYMSKIIIEKHMSGTISVENRDHGACFMIRFPLAKCP